MRAVLAAGAGFTGYRLCLASGTRSTPLHRFAEAGDDPGNGLLNAQLSLDLGRQRGYLLCIARILKAVKSASVGDRAHERCKLQRGLADLFAKAAQPADASVKWRRGRKVPSSLADNIHAGSFTISELVCVAADLFEAEFTAEGGKKKIVGMRQRVSQIDARATYWNRVARRDHFLTQSGQSDRNLEGGTRLEAVAQRQFLIQNRKNTTRRRVDDNHRSEMGPKGLLRDAPDCHVLASQVIAIGGVRVSRLRRRAPSNLAP